MAFTWVKYTRILVSMMSFAALSLAVFALATPNWLQLNSKWLDSSGKANKMVEKKVGLWQTCVENHCVGFGRKETLNLIGEGNHLTYHIKVLRY